MANPVAPLLVGVWPVVRPFFLPCPFRVRPLWARCVGVGVFPFFSSLLLRSRLGFRLGSLSSHCHLHVMFIFILSTLLRQGACVYHLNRCKTSVHCRGHGSCFPGHANEAMGFSRVGMWTHIPVPATIYSIVPPLGAYKSQLRVTSIFYRCCSILSLTPVIILYVYK